MFSLANLYIGALLIEHVLHNLQENKVDSLILRQWVAQRDMIPVVSRSMSGSYALEKKRLEEVVFEGYDPNSTVESDFIR